MLPYDLNFAALQTCPIKMPFRPRARTLIEQNLHFLITWHYRTTNGKIFSVSKDNKQANVLCYHWPVICKAWRHFLSTNTKVYLQFLIDLCKYLIVQYMYNIKPLQLARDAIIPQSWATVSRYAIKVDLFHPTYCKCMYQGVPVCCHLLTFYFGG